MRIHKFEKNQAGCGLAACPEEHDNAHSTQILLEDEDIQALLKEGGWLDIKAPLEKLLREYPAPTRELIALSFVWQRHGCTDVAPFTGICFQMMLAEGGGFQ